MTVAEDPEALEAPRKPREVRVRITISRFRILLSFLDSFGDELGGLGLFVGIFGSLGLTVFTDLFLCGGHYFLNCVLTVSMMSMIWSARVIQRFVISLIGWASIRMSAVKDAGTTTSKVIINPINPKILIICLSNQIPIIYVILFGKDWVSFPFQYSHHQY